MRRPRESGDPYSRGGGYGSPLSRGRQRAMRYGSRSAGLDCIRICNCPQTSPAVAKHNEGGVVVAALLELVESRGRGEAGACRLLDDDQRGRREPAAGAGRGQRRFGQAAAVGRIEKGERERLDRMRHAELARIAPENAGDAAQAQRHDILAQQGARLGSVVDEQRKCRAARERLEPERAGAGEEIEHARAGGRTGAAGASCGPIGAEKSAPAKAMTRSPSCSRRVRVLTSAISPGARSAS